MTWPVQPVDTVPAPTTLFPVAVLLGVPGKRTHFAAPLDSIRVEAAAAGWTAATNPAVRRGMTAVTANRARILRITEPFFTSEDDKEP
ncbi:hypothetical protein GCM10012278_91560 [Nonomuraea glycinis]|uniref:Uncharacterized protein n=1 Tax=Nonomuraea glycinis TaxID=2047744 RepID=A0A918AFL4_9ACTN|nr:hypothetical protein GCM10012278_91560 [Nonomuraea glycinis]